LGLHIGKEIALKLAVADYAVDRVPESIYGFLITQVLYCEGQLNNAFKAVELSTVNGANEGMVSAEKSMVGQSKDDDNFSDAEEGEGEDMGENGDEGGDEDHNRNAEFLARLHDNTVRRSPAAPIAPR
jgi:hypothetical protein